MRLKLFLGGFDDRILSFRGGRKKSSSSSSCFSLTRLMRQALRGKKKCVCVCVRGDLRWWKCMEWNSHTHTLGLESQGLTDTFRKKSKGGGLDSLKWHLILTQTTIQSGAKWVALFSGRSYSEKVCFFLLHSVAHKLRQEWISWGGDEMLTTHLLFLFEKKRKNNYERWMIQLLSCYKLITRL